MDDVKENPKSYTCFSCGVQHEKVECQGIYYCPNALCMGCGGGWFRQTLNSYHEVQGAPNGGHTVDYNEWLKKGTIHNKKHGIKRKSFYRTPPND